jgi:hypothetical protein
MWLIWKHRKSDVFDGERPSVPRVNEKIKAEAALCARAGALGLTCHLACRLGCTLISCNAKL